MRPALIAALLALAAAPLDAATLAVEVQGIAAQSGQLSLALYGSEAGWKGEAKPVDRRVGKPDGSSALRFTFVNLPPGRYAVRVAHDENGNGKLDTNFIGIPKEGVGSSNNPQVMRAPRFDEAVFELGEDDLGISIVLN
ncbi:DUF2141 domain-containing protein [Pseudomarimonas salicorniae]|uniref:DUF2141 domain-containing protein n=1 Tax=Pseudomarimonas salicorniae TaxID=2933270 RepID=A0ABT0GHH7_9GAMM|nr:DUF2141 domain-containing protein [Lysobacter sp. CAU 1642]MCK7593475.1 DUF2141 domain-containing protein [Lysobacter sp. CAU 1642]